VNKYHKYRSNVEKFGGRRTDIEVTKDDIQNKLVAALIFWLAVSLPTKPWPYHPRTRPANLKFLKTMWHWHT